MFWRCEAVLFYIVLCCMKLYEVLQKCSKYQQFHLISSDFINLRAWSWRLRSPSLPSLPSLRYRRSHSCGSARRDRRWSRHRNTHSHWQSGCPRGRQGSCDGILQQEWSAWIAMVLLLCCYSYYSCHCSGWGYTLRYTSGVRSITLHGPCIAAIQSNNYYSWSHGTSKDHVFGLGFQSMDATSSKSWNVMELSPKHDTHIQIVSELYINNQPTLSMILYVCPLLPDSKASLESKELIQCLKTSIDVRRRYTKIMWYHAAWCEYVRRLCSRSMP